MRPTPPSVRSRCSTWRAPVRGRGAGLRRARREYGLAPLQGERSCRRRRRAQLPARSEAVPVRRGSRRASRLPAVGYRGWRLELAGETAASPARASRVQRRPFDFGRRRGRLPRCAEATRRPERNTLSVAFSSMKMARRPAARAGAAAGEAHPLGRRRSRFTSGRPPRRRGTAALDASGIRSQFAELETAPPPAAGAAGVRPSENLAATRHGVRARRGAARGLGPSPSRARFDGSLEAIWRAPRRALAPFRRAPPCARYFLVDPYQVLEGARLGCRRGGWSLWRMLFAQRDRCTASIALVLAWQCSCCWKPSTAPRQSSSWAS